MINISNANKSEYLKLDVRAHEILKGVPLHDVWQLDLPDGGEGRTIEDIRCLSEESEQEFLVQLLLTIRWMLGSLFGWDKEPDDKEGLFQNLISEEDREKSSVSTGKKDGLFTILYVFPTEAMSEIRNSSVHAALVGVLLPFGTGYRLYWAIYVKPVGHLTKFYMALIKPFRKWIVYPSLLRNIHSSWDLKFNGVE
ncbi:MAG: DUF2867 domain-containing protein [Bacteroidetes bacterium]|nr:DUF2867 domain-containing protein [Bacteroidota bacterium]